MIRRPPRSTLFPYPTPSRSAPLMTELGIGELAFQAAQAERLSIIRGFAEVLPARVTVLAETAELAAEIDLERAEADRKSTRLNSSHSQISYAVFCLKKKKY